MYLSLGQDSICLINGLVETHKSVRYTFIRSRWNAQELYAGRVGPVMILIGILPETEEIDKCAPATTNLIGGEGFGGVELVLTGGIHRCAACPARDAIGHE